MAQLARNLLREFTRLVSCMPRNLHTPNNERNVFEEVGVDATRPASLCSHPRSGIVVPTSWLNNDSKFWLVLSRESDDFSNFQSRQHTGDLSLSVIERVSPCFLLLHAERVSDVQILQEVLNRVV